MNSETKPTLFTPGVGKRGMTELHFAAYRGDMEMLVHSLAAGLNPNSKDEYRGYTAHHWLADMAATGGPRVEMLRVLVENGANLDIVSDSGFTAYALATGAGSDAGDQLAIELLQLGAGTETKCQDP